jgi:hypothetical protein
MKEYDKDMMSVVFLLMFLLFPLHNDVHVVIIEHLQSIKKIISKEMFKGQVDT